MISLFTLGIFFQFLSALISLIFVRKNRTVFLTLLSVFLVITASVEIYCFLLMEEEKPTFIIHHLYSLIEYSIIFFMYSSLINDKKWLVLPKILIITAFLLWVTVFFDKDCFSRLVILGSVNVAVVVLLYLRELLLSDKILNYKRLLPFWVSVGFLVFYLPSIPFFSLLNYINTRGLFSILSVLIILMNLFIIIGLLWSNKEMKH
ncbi:conserved membrane hypothetical protein [Tenacibaculum sediminilitoris]|uniref:hypothetical protein n=1 Tax=Tenacibaculum sediminilitoris TaxID=1820334 RepID=UPI00389677D5